MMSAQSIEEVRAIDVHAHVGRCDRPANELLTRFTSAEGAEVVRRAAEANIEWTVFSPLRALMPRGKADPVAGNIEAARIIQEHASLLQWVVIDPREPKTYEQADEMLRHPRCMGIKIHPEEHLYHINEYGEAMFTFAAERRAVVLTHSGEENSLPANFVKFADAHPEMNLILAHIGCGWDGDLSHQVRAVARSKGGNMYADTSSASSITPNLIEYAVREIGAERVLFGTDTPLYSASMQRVRIDTATLSDAEKRLILRTNAERLLKIPHNP